MGQIYSSFKLKRKDKADRKRRLRERLDQAIEYIAHLEEQQRLLNENLQTLYLYHPVLRPEPKDEIEHRATELQDHVQTLERKLYLEEVALDVTEERCDFLDTNLSLLQQNEATLQWQCSNGQKNLDALRLKHEAYQFNLYQKANPIEEWTVRSLPNLYFTSM